MAKGIGLIGNFRGKVGNMVGYNLKDSNNKQTQGVRVYQPVVKNPKTYGQAEQRAKLAPINATYRALKAIIDRGQEGKAYGNKSRLAWLSDAMKAFNGGWFDKGVAITTPALIPLTKGSLPFNFPLSEGDSCPSISLTSAPESAITTIGALTTALIASYPNLKDGDQITVVVCSGSASGFVAEFDSVELASASTAALPSFITVSGSDVKFFDTGDDFAAGSIIVSREGENGQHLRNSASIKQLVDYATQTLEPAAKEAAIKSYMAAGANTDWAEESLQ